MGGRGRPMGRGAVVGEVGGATPTAGGEVRLSGRSWGDHDGARVSASALHGCSLPTTLYIPRLQVPARAAPRVLTASAPPASEVQAGTTATEEDQEAAIALTVKRYL